MAKIIVTTDAGEVVSVLTDVEDTIGEPWKDHSATALGFVECLRDGVLKARRMEDRSPTGFARAKTTKTRSRCRLRWLKEGKARGATHMAVARDAGGDVYPIYVMPGDDPNRPSRDPRTKVLKLYVLAQE